MGNSCSCRCSSKSSTAPDGVRAVEIPSNSTNPPALLPSNPPIAPNIRKTVVALCTYQARYSQDVSFVKGDRMEVVDETEEYWPRVEHLITHETGYVPKNFVAEELSIESEDWFFENVSRKEAEKLLLDYKKQPAGTFLIRPSESNMSGYSLSIKDWKIGQGWVVRNYKIYTTTNGRYYLSPTLTVSSLHQLVAEYAKKSQGICKKLSEPCHKPTPMLYELASKYRDKWEIDRDEIILTRRLGEGHFGEVHHAMWKNYYQVAVKKINYSSINIKQEFLLEAAIMKKIRHKTLVQLYGVCTTQEPFYIVQEYMAKGSLLDFLQLDLGKTLKFRDQIFIAYQVANGMAYLEQRNIIHRDLAARNVLLSENNLVKICDFGMARILADPIYVTQNPRSLVPAKWSAPEALNGNFTIKSDVWSYGIFLMELFTFGKTLYQGIKNIDVPVIVKSGYRMKKPPNLPTEIYTKMLKCWHEIPESRPTFQDLENYFESMEVSDGRNGSIVLSFSNEYTLPKNKDFSKK